MNWLAQSAITGSSVVEPPTRMVPSNLDSWANVSGTVRSNTHTVVATVRTILFIVFPPFISIFVRVNDCVKMSEWLEIG